MLPSIGSGHHHFYFPAAARRAYQPLPQLRNWHVGALPLRLLGWVGLDLMVAYLAPHDEVYASPRGVAERHRRTRRRGFQRLPAIAAPARRAL